MCMQHACTEYKNMNIQEQSESKVMQIQIGYNTILDLQTNSTEDACMHWSQQCNTIQY